ncbi:hypothetical protein SAMN05216262_101499 [Colwellia chukchiensis]|uniref:Flagellar protein FliT n=1 Tax=Colwellia chukchiensis TaxID=641665 RepID=A0A1H7HH02_9GAMM|nr:hypothetical protein [Colwellia chukchiensis]SEK49653.1 hypothetical protein SAMN05216262_101499 [Colwellia chukchiensis]
MVFERFTCEIKDLSAQIEALIAAGNEASCAALLEQRLTLLKALDEHMATDPAKSAHYRDFLLSIQARDNQALKLVHESKNKIVAVASQQKKRTNALNAYQKFSD